MISEKQKTLKNQILSGEYLNISSDVPPADRIAACMAALAELKKELELLKSTGHNQSEPKKDPKQKKKGFFSD